MRRALHVQTLSQRGATLIELVVALAVAATLISGVWSGWQLMTRRSADPLVLRQSLAVAESLLGEISLQEAGAASGATGTDRSSYRTVADYDGLALDGITDVQGNAVPGLAGYAARVSVQPTALQGVPQAYGWWIAVRVTGPNGVDTRLAGWRAQR
jgi:MSHA pilin protein MshD